MSTYFLMVREGPWPSFLWEPPVRELSGIGLSQGDRGGSGTWRHCWSIWSLLCLLCDREKRAHKSWIGRKHDGKSLWTARKSQIQLQSATDWVFFPDGQPFSAQLFKNRCDAGYGTSVLAINQIIIKLFGNFSYKKKAGF